MRIMYSYKMEIQGYGILSKEHCSLMSFTRFLGVFYSFFLQVV
jgi:hypothetical protein